MFEDSLKGKLLDQATGDPQANNGSQTPTGVSEIQFTVTDAQLKKPGYTYKITVVDQNGTLLSNKEYTSLAEALDVWGFLMIRPMGKLQRKTSSSNIPLISKKQW